MSLSAKDLLQSLVAIPSVNPAFPANDTTAGGESEIIDFFQFFFEARGWPCLRQVVHQGRDNLVVVCHANALAGQESDVEGAILWECHQDTVGVAGMTIDPFAASESQGRIWGRGACDVKGSMAAMVTALVRAQDEQAQLPRTLVLALTINEECGFSGVNALCRLWGTEEQAAVEADNVSGSLSLAELRELRPVRAIVAEPTLLDVVVAHKGSVRWRCHTHGKAAHTSRPEHGENAILAMVRVVQAIERYQKEVLDHYTVHPLCGRPTVCVSMIQGGSGVNTVPDHAVIDIDRRLVPGETPAAAHQELVQYIAHSLDHETDGLTGRAAGVTVEHEEPSSQSSGLSDADNHVWAQQITGVVDSVAAGLLGRASRLIGAPFGTDAWALSEAGIPTVVFGPGSIEQAHTADEWIDIDQLEHGAEIFYRLAVGRQS